MKAINKHCRKILNKFVFSILVLIIIGINPLVAWCEGGRSPVALSTYVIKTKTDSSGRFIVEHNIAKPSGDGLHIQGIVVSIKHKNGNWHTLEFSNNVDNRFWWNDRYVQGVIASTPNFSNRPVKIIVFAQFIVG